MPFTPNAQGQWQMTTCSHPLGRRGPAGLGFLEWLQVSEFMQQKFYQLHKSWKNSIKANNCKTTCPLHCLQDKCLSSLPITVSGKRVGGKRGSNTWSCQNPDKQGSIPREQVLESAETTQSQACKSGADNPCFIMGPSHRRLCSHFLDIETVCPLASKI